MEKKEKTGLSCLLGRLEQKRACAVVHISWGRAAGHGGFHLVLFFVRLFPFQSHFLLYPHNKGNLLLSHELLLYLAKYYNQESHFLETPFQAGNIINIISSAGPSAVLKDGIDFFSECRMNLSMAAHGSDCSLVSSYGR